MKRNNSDEKMRKMYEKLNEIGANFHLTKVDGTKVNGKVVKIEEYKGIRIIFGDTQYEAKTQPATVCHLYGNTYMLVRNMRALVKEFKLTSEERKCVYLHEVGHILSKNQKSKKCLENEIDADRYAIIECGADPNVMKNALLKNRIFVLKNQNRYTNEEIEADEKEFEARINSIEMLNIPKKLINVGENYARNNRDDEREDR